MPRGLGFGSKTDAAEFVFGESNAPGESVATVDRELRAQTALETLL